MSDIHSGSCNCGAVRLRTTGKLRDVIYCHCSQCRKQTGLYYAATNIGDSELEVEGAEHITWYQSSDFAKRGFCKVCGSALFWKPRDHEYTSVMAGLFESPTGLAASVHIFTADKGDFYAIADGLPQYDRSTPAVKVAGG